MKLSLIEYYAQAAKTWLGTLGPQAPIESKHRYLTREECPALWYLCDEVARALKAPGFSQIKMLPRFSDSGILVLPGRVLALHIPSALDWGTDQLTAVIAHEIGHLKQRVLLPAITRSKMKGLGTPSRASKMSERWADHYAAKLMGGQLVVKALLRNTARVVMSRCFPAIPLNTHKDMGRALWGFEDYINLRMSSLIDAEQENATHPLIRERLAYLRAYGSGMWSESPVSQVLLEQELDPLQTP